MNQADARRAYRPYPEGRRLGRSKAAARCASTAHAGPTARLWRQGCTGQSRDCRLRARLPQYQAGRDRGQGLGQPLTEGVGQAKRYAAKLAVRSAFATNGRAIYGIDMATGIIFFCVHSDSQFNARARRPLPGASHGNQVCRHPKVPVRTGRLHCIRDPVAITRHGQTVGFFIPTKSRGGADRAALKKATADMDRLRVTGSEGVSTVASDVEAGRKTRKRAAGACRRHGP